MILPLILFFYIFSCWIVAYSGRNRLFGFWGYFFASLLLTPLLGLLFVIASSGSERYLVSVDEEELRELRARRATSKAAKASVAPVATAVPVSNE